MVITPLAILVLGVVNFRRDKLRQGVIVLQAVAALAVWTILTFVIVMIFFMTVFEYPAYRSRADEIKSTAIFDWRKFDLLSSGRRSDLLDEALDKANAWNGSLVLKASSGDDDNWVFFTTC